MMSGGNGLSFMSYKPALLLVLATVPVLDPAGIIGLRGNGLTPSINDDFLSEPSL